jgi:hypothetical protein
MKKATSGSQKKRQAALSQMKKHTRVKVKYLASIVIRVPKDFRRNF